MRASEREDHSTPEGTQSSSERSSLLTELGHQRGDIDEKRVVKGTDVVLTRPALGNDRGMGLVTGGTRRKAGQMPAMI